MPVEHAGWMRRSRFLGAMRYHRALSLIHI